MKIRGKNAIETISARLLRDLLYLKCVYSFWRIGIVNRRDPSDPRQQLPPDRGQLEAVISRIPNDRHRMFLFCLFITGARVSEVLSLRRMDFDFSEDGESFRIQVPTLKSSVVDERRIPIKYFKHKQLIDELIQYINFFDNDFEFIFKIHRVSAWRIVKKYFGDKGWFPHLFRHFLANHLVQSDDMNEWKLKRFFGWSDSRSAMKYTNASTKPLEDLDF